MNRIETRLARLRETNKKSLSPYITAGAPTIEITVPLMHALVDAGADILEVGIPFSDPMAEGGVIQKAMEQAISLGVNCHVVLEMIEQFRMHNTDTPVILMGYMNSIEQYGFERFALKAKQVGVDGTIIVDCPPEESEEIVALWQEHELIPIYLCSPTTSDERMSLINQVGQGYLYYVSLKGVTGSESFNLEDVKRNYHRRKSQTHLPLMVGFGIKTSNMAAEVAAFADGVIVGAALISCIQHRYETNQSAEEAIQAGYQLICDMRESMDTGTSV